MGSAAAYWLSQKTNRKIIQLDKYGLANDYCSSNDANRVFRFAYGDDAYYTRMAVEGLKLWKALEEETGERLLIETGVLLIEGDDEESNRFNTDSYKTLTGMGLPAEQLDSSDLKERFPQFHATKAFLDNSGGVLLASKILSTLHSQAKTRGVTTMGGCGASGVQPGSQPQVETPTGQTIKCKKLIVTLGPWSKSLLRKGLPPVTPTRQQVVYLRPENGLGMFRPGKFPVFFANQYYGIPAAGIEGVKVSHKGLWEPVDPETCNREVDRQAVENCRELCRQFIPELAGGQVVHTKVCLYDMTENSDFVIGKDTEYPNMIYGYGFSGHGFKFAPLIGKLLSELALDKELSYDITRLSPAKGSRQTLSEAKTVS